MKAKKNWVIISIMGWAILGTVHLFAQKQNDERLLQVRETVWRACFAGDTKTLKELVPPETIVMTGGEEEWKHQADVLRTATEFHTKGGRTVNHLGQNIIDHPSRRASKD
jgi:hypothetical protein